MTALIPYAALPGFNLNAVIREIAAHYGLRARVLKSADGRRNETVAQARDALFWKLCEQCGLSETRAAQLMRVSAKTVREAKARHTHRITEFAATVRNGAKA